VTLNSQQLARAQRLHAESIILLAHDHFFPPDDLEALRQGKVTAKILMAVVDARLWSRDVEDYRRSVVEIEGWFSYAQQIYQRILRDIGSSPALTLIRNAHDIVEAKKAARIGIILGAEGGKLIEHSLNNLRSLYDTGVRHILLTWAYNNQISAAETDLDGNGLTDFGRQVVEAMNRWGMVIDITHLSRAAMREVLELSSRPVLNSHTSLKSIASRVPAMTEAEIRSVADKGGVIALHFMTHMLTGRFAPRAQIEDVLRQIDAIVNIGGVDCLALGPDYLANTDDFRRNTGQWDLSFPEMLESPADLRNLIEGLVGRGYSDGAIQKILGGNLLRLFRDTLGAGGGERAASSR
jgi:membrane dipeptidase